MLRYVFVNSSTEILISFATVGGLKFLTARICKRNSQVLNLIIFPGMNHFSERTMREKIHSLALIEACTTMLSIRKIFSNFFKIKILFRVTAIPYYSRRLLAIPF